MAEISYRFIKDVDVSANFQKICENLTAEYFLKEILSLKQVHSDIILVDESGEGDGIIITKPMTAAMVRTADCFSVVLIDQDAGISGVFHSGWRGTELGISAKGAEMMKKMGCSNIEAVIFPGIEKCCFEIGSELIERFDTAGIPVEKRDGRYFADLKWSIIEQLKGKGIINIKDLSECTFCNKGYFSFRKDKTAKRHGSYVMNIS